MSGVQIRTLQKQLATKKAMLKTLSQKCQLQNVLMNKKIKLLRKENQQLKTTVDKQTQQDTAILLNSKELSDANSKLQTAIQQLQKKMSQPMISASHNQNGVIQESQIPEMMTVGTATITEQSQDLDLVNQGLKDEDILPITVFVNLKTVILGENLLTDIGVKGICQKLINVRKLYLNHNNFTNEGLTTLKNMQALKHLDIRNNKLGDDCMKQISKLSQNLTELSVSQNKLTDKSTVQLLKLKQLTYLDITNNSLTDEGVRSILKLKKLTHLYISSNKLTGLSVKWIVQELKELVVLDVRFNNVGNQEKDGIRAMKRQELQVFL